MLKLQMSSAILYVLHFFLLEGYTGAVVNVVVAGRNYIYNQPGYAKRRWIPLVFIVFFVIAGLLAWEGPISLLPLIASVTGTLAYWQQNPSLIRRIELISPPLWIIYSVSVQSYPSIINELFLLGSILVGIYRFDIRSTAKEETKTEAVKRAH